MSPQPSTVPRPKRATYPRITLSKPFVPCLALPVARATGTMPSLGGKGTNNMPMRYILVDFIRTLLVGLLLTTIGIVVTAKAQYSAPIQPWGLPPLPSGIGPVEKFADVGN